MKFKHFLCFKFNLKKKIREEIYFSSYFHVSITKYFDYFLSVVKYFEMKFGFFMFMKR